MKLPETARNINNEITSQVTSELDEIRGNLKTQILEVVNSAIAERVLPSIQNVLEVQKLGLNTMRDHRSGRLDRSSEDHFTQMDYRSRRLGKSPGDHFSRQDRCKSNSKFSTHGGLIR